MISVHNRNSWVNRRCDWTLGQGDIPCELRLPWCHVNISIFCFYHCTKLFQENPYFCIPDNSSRSLQKFRKRQGSLNALRDHTHWPLSDSICIYGNIAKNGYSTHSFASLTDLCKRGLSFCYYQQILMFYIKISSNSEFVLYQCESTLISRTCAVRIPICWSNIYLF